MEIVAAVGSVVLVVIIFGMTGGEDSNDYY